MVEKIIMAGAGGQGIMFLGKLLAEAAMKENKYVTWMPSYGAEVRGGTANCIVIVSDEEIGSPYIEKAGTLIIMNGPSWERFKSKIEDKGLFIINSSLVKKNVGKKVRTLYYPFTDIALELGNIKVANMVALGCYIAAGKVIDIKTVLEVIKNLTPGNKRELIQINEQALSAGMELVR